jgi:hypothetical protein
MGLSDAFVLCPKDSRALFQLPTAAEIALGGWPAAGFEVNTRSSALAFPPEKPRFPQFPKSQMIPTDHFVG